MENAKLYELAYYVGDERRDLLVDLNQAIDWCERELTGMEANLPAP